MKTTKHMTIRQKLNTEKAAGIVCTMPFIVGFLAFMIIPMCISLYYSFCDYNILQPPTFTGWANFKRMFSDATFYQIRDHIGSVTTDLRTDRCVAFI